MRIELSATSVAATCQGNGEIHCSVTYSDGLDIEQLRYFYIPLSGIDSIMETSLPYITHLRPGNYMVKVSALCNTGLPQGDRYVVISDSAEILVESAYTIPSSGMIYNIYSHTLPYGIVPSMACEPTGKIQVKIQDGTFPYHLDIWTVTDTGLVFFRAQDFDTLEHFGADSMRYDYLHYYTIDSLPAGTYRIICHDGCGYHTPYLQAIVPKVKHYDHIYNHQLRNSSGDPESYNVIPSRSYGTLTPTSGTTTTTTGKPDGIFPICIVSSTPLSARRTTQRLGSRSPTSKTLFSYMTHFPPCTTMVNCGNVLLSCSYSHPAETRFSPIPSPSIFTAAIILQRKEKPSIKLIHSQSSTIAGTQTE